MTYKCPVCGYDQLKQPASNDMICPCCGTQFGYDDYAQSHIALRERWIEGGCKWYSRRTPPPADWSMLLAREQMIHAGLIPAVYNFQELPGARVEMGLRRVVNFSSGKAYESLSTRSLIHMKAVKQITADVSTSTYLKAA